MKANSDDTVVIPNDYAIGEGNRDIIGGGSNFYSSLYLVLLPIIELK
ncbi:MAG: hypothetical protein WAL24_12085 [Nitrososphaeraceae archaeon]